MKSQPPLSQPAAASSGLNPSAMLAVAEPVMRASGALLKTVDEYRGQKIIGMDRQELGTLDDFMVDTETGKVVYAVAKLQSGTTEGVRLIQQSSLRATDQGFRAELDREAFNNLEVLTTAQLDATRATPVPVQSQRLSSDVEQKPTSAAPATTPAIGLLPPAADSVAAAATAAAAHPDPVTPATTEPVEVTAAPSTGPSLEPPQRETHLVRASQLKGKAVRSGNRPLGIIEAIALDLGDGKAMALFQLAGQPTGGDTKYYLPLPRLQFGAVDEPASTSLTPTDFERAHPREQAPTKVGISVRSEENVSPTGRASTSSPASARTDVDHDRAKSGPR